MKWKWLMFWKRRHNVSVAVSKATHLLSHKNTTLQSAPSCTLAWTHLPHGSAKCFSNAWLFIWLNRQVIRQLIDSVSYSSCHTTMLLYALAIKLCQTVYRRKLILDTCLHLLVSEAQSKQPKPQMAHQSVSLTQPTLPDGRGAREASTFGRNSISITII